MSDQGITIGNHRSPCVTMRSPMSFERRATPAPEPVRPGGAATGEPTSPGQRLQIPSTEHWSLLATRSMTWKSRSAG
jgi:hypothetical protein